MQDDNRKKWAAVIKFMMLMLTVGMIASIMMSRPSLDVPLTLTYDEVIAYVNSEEITKVTMTKGSSDVSVVLTEGVKAEVTVPSVEKFTEFISKKIEEGADIKFEVETRSSTVNEVLNAISVFFMFLLPVLLFVSLFRALKSMKVGMQGGIDQMINGGGDIQPVSSDTTFDDVAGIAEEKGQLVEVVEFLRHPEKYREMGARIPNGILLYGDPGTGKTLLARAIAGEAGVPFFKQSGSDFDEVFVGLGASKVRKLFHEARKKAPCLIFIDEIDSVAKSRYGRDSSSEQTLNQLLAEIDGFESRNDNVIVIAATNHLDVLDPAITRRGRFDRQIFIPMPDLTAREEILEVHARNKRLADDVSLSDIAKKTVGFSGADLESTLNEAAILAVNQNKVCITMSDVDEAIARILVGLKKESRTVTDDDKRLTAIHEAGHAIVSAVVRPEVKNFGISIVPRGKAGGYNFFDVSGKTYKRKKEILDEIMVCYGGRAAEEIILGDISTGASGDLEQASKLAHEMVTRLAMNDALLVKISREGDYNMQLDKERMDHAEKICQKAYEDTLNVIKTHREQLVQLAKLLFVKEYLSAEEVEKFVENYIG